MAYNDTVHSNTGMAPSRLSYVDVLAMWHRMESKSCRVTVATAKFRVGQHMRITKKKMKFNKAVEHNFSTEIFKITKEIKRRPRAFCEL